MRLRRISRRAPSTAQSNVDLAEIRLAQAEVELSRHSNGPFSGRIGITDVEIGDRVDTSTVITTLDDRSVLLVDFTVPESFIGRIVTDLEAQARQWSPRRQYLRADCRG